MEAVAMIAFVLLVATAAQAGAPDPVVVTEQLVCEPVLGSAPTAESEVVRRYAPLVFLARSDKSFPADPCEFIERSSLRWARARGFDIEVLARGQVSPADLGIGAVAIRPTSGPEGERGPVYQTDELTSPARSGSSRHRPAGSAAGFFLDLDNDARPGVKPLDRAYSNAPALYYEFKPRHYIVYWFFHAFNGRALDKHEGDWERIAVRLNRENEATQVAYYQHRCDPFKGAKYGTFNWREMQARGFLAEGTHPKVYSAIEAHASYPAPVYVQMRPCGSVKKGVFDRTGVPRRAWKWRTWTGRLANAAHQLWYGFGGSWGEKLPDSVGWGPLGPGLPMRGEGPLVSAAWD